MKKCRNEKKYHRKLVIAIIITTLVFVIGTSYAFFTLTLKAEKELSIVAGTFRIDYKDQNTIFLDNLYPMSDQKGMRSPVYEFCIENTGDIKALYDISLEEEENSNLNYTWLKYSIKKNEEEWSMPEKITSLKLEEGFELDPNEKDTYQLRLWIDESVGNEAQGKVFIAKVVVNGVQSNAKTEDIVPAVITLNGSLSESVEQGAEYTDPGVESVIDDHDELNISDVKISYQYFDGEETMDVENIDTSQVGVYYIYYKIKDQSGNEGKVVRCINVYKKDTTPPVIRLNGEDRVAIERDSHYEELGATASKNEEDLTNRVVTVGTVNTKRTGTYEVKYLITDQVGNTASIVRVVNVVYIKTEVKDAITIDLSRSSKDQIPLEGENLGDVIYTSSNVGVASVDGDGNVEGHEVGEAIIKITTSTGVKKEVRVTVVKTVTATYVMQGSGVTSIEKTSDSCLVTTSGKGCEVTSPDIRVNSGYTAVGWNINKDATSGTAANSKITLSENATYYSISYKNAVTRSITYVSGTGVSSIGQTSASCTIPAAYNNVIQGTSCNVVLPSISVGVGYMGPSWYTSNATAGTSYSANTSYTLSSNATLYAVAKRNFTCASGGSTTSYAGRSWYTVANDGTNCTLALNTMSSSAGGYSEATSKLTSEYFTSGSVLLAEKNAGLNSVLGTYTAANGLSGSGIIWTSSSNATPINKQFTVYSNKTSNLFSGGDHLTASTTHSYTAKSMVTSYNASTTSSCSSISNNQCVVNNTSVAGNVSNHGSTQYAKFTFYSSSEGNDNSFRVKRVNYPSGASTNPTQFWLYLFPCGGVRHDDLMYELRAKSAASVYFSNYSTATRDQTISKASKHEFYMAGNVDSTTYDVSGIHREYRFSKSSNCIPTYTYTYANSSYPVQYRLYIRVKM